MAGRGIRTEVFAFDYNQMEDDYNNPELNSYETGPGSNLRQSKPKEGGNNRLHVTNIPARLTENGLRNIFSSEGDVPEAVYISKPHQQLNTSWAFVTFKTAGAAQSAMSAINRKPPYHFNVSFARCNGDDKSDISKERQSMDKKLLTNKSSRESITPSPRGRGKLPPMQGRPPSAFRALESNDESYIDDLGEDYSPGRFSHCGTSLEKNASNSVFSPYAEGEYDDGKRKMSMGRGSFISSRETQPIEKLEKDEENQDMEHKVAAYFGNQTKEFLFGDDAIISSETKLSLPIKPGHCTYCSRPAIYICSKCKCWYCTNYCRKKHWSVHKSVCVPRVLEFQNGIPVYKVISETSCVENLKKNSNGKDPTKTDKKFNNFDCKNDSIGSHNGVRMERIKAPITSGNFSDNVDHKNKSLDIENYRFNREYNKEGGKYKEDLDKKRQRYYKKVENDVFIKAPPPAPNGSLAKSEGNRPQDLDKSPIPAGIFTEVAIGALMSDREFYAYKVDDILKQSDMMTKLNEYISNGKTSNLKVEVGAKCIAPFENDWYRAEILEVSQGNVKVKFIDFGNECDVTIREIKELPKELSEEPPMAHKFLLAVSLNNPELKDGLNLAIKPISQDGHDKWIVHVEGIDYVDRYEKLIDGTAVCQVQESGSPANKQVKHFLYMLQSNEIATLQIEKIMNDEFLTGSIMDSGQVPVYQEISKIIGEEIIPQNGMKLVPGMNLAAKWKNNWYRGYLMMLRNNKPIVALIDKGKVVIPESVVALPKKVLHIPESGVRVIFDEPVLDRKEVGKTVYVKSIKFDHENNHVHGEIDGYGSVIMLPWVPAIEEAGLDCIEIPSGSKVQISSYHSPSAIYVHSCDPNHKTICSELLQDVASCAKGENLKRKPLVGEFLACRFVDDGNYYRAQVYRREGEKYKVNFVDYGNTEVVSLDEMKQLPDSLKRIPCCAVKVGLKDVPDVPFNKECMKFLNELAANSIEMFLTYEKDLQEASLELREGDLINKILCNFLEPSWSKPDYNPLRAHVFMESEIKYETWKKGSKFTIAVVYVKRHDSVLVLRPESNLLTLVQETLTPMITSYCESKAKDPYNPRRCELCLAKFHEDQNWYRAICLNSYQHNASEVFYFDYGNSGEVLHRCIRKMVPEFMEAPAVLKSCRIYGFPEKIPEPLISKLMGYLSSLRTEAEVLEDVGGICIIRIPAFESYASQLGISVKPPSSS